MKTVVFVLLAAFSLSSLPLAAQDSDPADHPAAKIVLEYLETALKRDWKKSTAYIAPMSLANLQRGWIAKAKRAPTIDAEKQLVRSVGKESLTEVAEMPPADFYAAYHISLQARFNLTPERIKLIAETIDLRVLSVAEESDHLVHVLVRTEHQDNGKQISNLELISLVKAGEKWRVSLDEQGPKVTPSAPK